VAWEPADYIALVSVLVAPLAALGGAWLNSYLSRRAKAEEHSETLRKENAQAIAPMFGILVDAEPSLIAGSQLREYDSPRAGVEGLHGRWTVAREPLLVMHYAHQSESVRRLAFAFQATVEWSLRKTSEWIESEGGKPVHFPGKSPREAAEAAHDEAQKMATDLARAIQNPAA
jgi:hypothetical protein